MDGSCVQDIAPLILNLVNTRRRSKRTAQEAFQNDRWTTDIMGDLPPMDTCNINMFSCAWSFWTWTGLETPRIRTSFPGFCDASGNFSARSTYGRLCEGGIRFTAVDGIWKPWAPYKCKICLWLAVQYRVWTIERRARHGLQAVANVCFTCLQDVDTLDHILLHCSYAKEVVDASSQPAGCHTSQRGQTGGVVDAVSSKGSVEWEEDFWRQSYAHQLVSLEAA
jgi:hypothetical protein